MALTFESIRGAFPKEGLFEGKEWLLSPEPFRLERAAWEQIQALGPLLYHFLHAANGLYRDSRAKAQFPWVAHWLDRGKPPEICEIGMEPAAERQIPEVIRPDLLLTAEGLSLTEIDSLPGGIGVLAWLNQLYARAGWDVIGGESGMLRGFSRVVQDGVVVFSDESAGYRPEMEWILNRIESGSGGAARILHEAGWDPHKHPAHRVYRFFELWDLERVRNADVFLQLARSGRTAFTPPWKAFLEEKLWLAFFWSPGLRAAWGERLGQTRWEKLSNHIPRGWVIDPEPIPYFGEYPGLGIQSWEELKGFTQKERQLVLKISGFSETAWGSRGVYVGHDMSAGDWSAAVESALRSAGHHPFLLQRFHQAKVVEHPFWDPLTGEARRMRGRVRLCPYFFPAGESVELGGVLATICPEDKKIIHGMRDSILVPCVPDPEMAG
jgi:hypothetical protein